MKIIVCIKQVPDSTEVRLDPETNTLIREGVPAIVNPFDLYAVEEGLRLRERLGGTVTALTMGPPQAESALREVIAMGVDEGVLLTDRAFAGSDTLATSYALAQAVRTLGGADLIICGKQAIDGDTAQVGPGLAEQLGIPFVAFVGKVAEADERRLVVHRLMEDGHDVVEMPLPGLITVVKEINEPRLPSLRGKMRAKSAQIRRLSAADVGGDPSRFGLKGSPTQVWRTFTPEPRGAGEILTGEPEEVAAVLVERLREAKVL